MVDRATGNFFFQAEDGIRDGRVTGVQTCALPISFPGANGGSEWSPVAYSPDTRMVYVLGLHQPMNYITHSAAFDRGKRSEERRVGEEGRDRGAGSLYKNKDKKTEVERPTRQTIPP